MIEYPRFLVIVNNPGCIREEHDDERHFREQVQGRGLLVHVDDSVDTTTWSPSLARGEDSVRRAAHDAWSIPQRSWWTR